MPEHELVEVDGEMASAGAAMGPIEPRLHVPDRWVEVWDGVHEGDTRGLHDPDVDEAGLREREVGGPTICRDRRADLDDLLDVPDERRRGVIGDDPSPKALREAGVPDFESVSSA